MLPFHELIFYSEVPNACWKFWNKNFYIKQSRNVCHYIKKKYYWELLVWIRNIWKEKKIPEMHEANDANELNTLIFYLLCILSVVIEHPFHRIGKSVPCRQSFCHRLLNNRPTRWHKNAAAVEIFERLYGLPYFNISNFKTK